MSEKNQKYYVLPLRNFHRRQNIFFTAFTLFIVTYFYFLLILYFYLKHYTYNNLIPFNNRKLGMYVNPLYLHIILSALHTHSCSCAEKFFKSEMDEKCLYWMDVEIQHIYLKCDENQIRVRSFFMLLENSMVQWGRLVFLFTRHFVSFNFYFKSFKIGFLLLTTNFCINFCWRRFTI